MKLDAAAPRPRELELRQMQVLSAVDAALAARLLDRYRRPFDSCLRAAAEQVIAVDPVDLEGWRLYVTNSLLSSWDNQFYPDLRAYLLKVDIGEDGSMTVDPDFFVDFHNRPDGPARAHEVRLEGGGCTTEIFP